MCLKNVCASVVVLSLMLAGTAGLAADAPRRELMHLQVGLGEGLTGVSAYQGGREMDLGFLGGDVDRHFERSPAALAEAHRYRAYRRTGLGLWGAGLAALAVDVGLLAYAEDTRRPGWEPSRAEVGLYVGLLAGGLVGSVVGGLLLQESSSHLAQAVRYYNEDLVEGQLRPAPGLSYDLMVPADGGAGVLLTARF